MALLLHLSALGVLTASCALSTVGLVDTCQSATSLGDCQDVFRVLSKNWNVFVGMLCVAWTGVLMLLCAVVRETFLFNTFYEDEKAEK